jgi:hypothetical protein
MNNEIALLFAEATEGCDILRLFLKVILKNPKICPSEYQIKEFVAQDGNKTTYHPSLEAHGAHIDIGYHLTYEQHPQKDNVVLWVGLCLQSYQLPNIFAWIVLRYRKNFSKTRGIHYGPPEVSDGIWLPLRLPERDALFNPDTSDADREDILKGFFDEVIKQITTSQNASYGRCQRPYVRLRYKEGKRHFKKINALCRRKRR